MPVLAPEREAVGLPPAPAPPVSSAWLPPSRRRRAVGRLLGAAVLAALAFAGLNRITDLLPSLANPFRTDTVDRTGPAVLRALDDLQEYRAATGSFQVIVDLEKDAKYVPSFVKGERTLFLAQGSVDAGVDFSGLGPGSVEVGPGQVVSITLPHARLSDPRVDTGTSRVVSRDRGLLDRLGSVFSDSPTGEKALYRVAERRLVAAAVESGLVARAEDNTRQMLDQLLRSVGVADVHVNFAEALD